MTPLQKIELRVLQLVPSLNLRPTLDRSAELGELLCEAKQVVEYGQWGLWLKRVGLSERTGRTHMQVYRHITERPATAGLTIEQFLSYMRQSRIASRRAEREEARAEAAERIGRLPDGIRLHHADCRKHWWPKAQAICTDPPWADMECYEWLADMAAAKLHDGGLLMVQVGTAYLDHVMRIMGDAGLKYQWCLSIAYADIRGTKPTAGRYLAAWKPILLYSQGQMPPGDYLGDIYTLRKSEDRKSLHDWQQSEVALKYWVERLVRPGGLILDPFAGSGTTAVVARAIGCRWVGTEVDLKAYRVARGRLLAEVEKPVPTGG